jgi:hypothetical protein
MEPVQQSVQDARGRFMAGNNANPTGRPTKAQRHAQQVAKVAELASRFGGVENLDPIERERIRLAAQLLLRRPATHEDQVRCINSADRLIARVERSQRARRHQRPSFAEALAKRNAKP